MQAFCFAAGNAGEQGDHQQRVGAGGSIDRTVQAETAVDQRGDGSEQQRADGAAGEQGGDQRRRTAADLQRAVAHQAGEQTGVKEAERAAGNQDNGSIGAVADKRDRHQPDGGTNQQEGAQFHPFNGELIEEQTRRFRHPVNGSKQRGLFWQHMETPQQIARCPHSKNRLRQQEQE
ncbi:hypothetical protein D3C86_1658960 [compost metagenome]